MKKVGVWVTSPEISGPIQARAPSDGLPQQWAV